ncbi:EMYY motif lipoprotein [Staphylococcus hominis]|uniref:EMYY motif lipoprotein n=1 Tax=Staphylococcus hominis TaxID=1290 RepID=UPI001F5708A1|nr:EMYY motif lipoprotein [Staphylococcus hominis]MCI2926349.1 EMYY motif lipoprotein [Staphylococcus hominis]
MKKLIILSLYSLYCLILSGCGENNNEDLNRFKQHLSKVETKQKSVEKVMNQLELNRLNDISKTDTTDKNKKSFERLQKNINHRLVPEFKEYEKEAKHLPAKTNKTRQLKKDYLNHVSKQHQSINEIKSFVDLYNQSVVENEKILNYTHSFEINRALVEKDIRKTNNQENAHLLKSKIENNNRNLRKTAQKYLEKDNYPTSKAINEHIKPLIQKQIKDLNQTNITDSHVNNARKNAIEMYYNLLNYYETRETTIKIEDQLSKINVEKLPKTGKDLSKGNHNFKTKLEKV